MKNLRKNIWVFILLVCLCFVANAQNASDFQTRTENGTITITGYTGSEKNINIPEKIDGIPVTAIADKAFESKGLTGVTIANGVKTIGINAFAFNPFVNIQIPNSVTSIESRAFYNNVIENMVNIGGMSTATRFNINLLIGSNVKLAVDSFNIDFYALYDKVGKTRGRYTLKGGRWISESGQTSGDFLSGFSWDGKGTITIWAYTGTEKNIVIPETIAGIPVENIIANSFGQKGITSITVPRSVISIEDRSPMHTVSDSTISRFATFYNQTEKRAGKYTLSGNNWVFSEN